MPTITLRDVLNSSALNLVYSTPNTYTSLTEGEMPDGGRVLKNLYEETVIPPAHDAAISLLSFETRIHDPAHAQEAPLLGKVKYDACVNNNAKRPKRASEEWTTWLAYP